MNLWSTREQSIRWLQKELLQESEVIKHGFELIDDGIKLFERAGGDEGETLDGQFCRVCCVTLSKSSHFLLACYSLALDGLAQESGAILRPFIESYELLVYLRLDKSRVIQVLDENLPTSGVIAKKVTGDFKDLREHLNISASHFSYKIESVKHLHGKNFGFRSLPKHSIKVFRTNIGLINVLQVIVLFEVANCLFSTPYGSESLASEIKDLKNKSKELFPTEKLSG